MTLATTGTANDILNTVAAEVGLAPLDDPFASTESNFVQLQYLLNTCCKELTRHFDWEFLVSSHAIATVVGDTGSYPLPSDFLRMIDQTGWERNNRNPLNPLSAQQWEYLKGRDLASDTIWVNFRVMQGSFEIYPSPVQAIYNINFEYVSKNCVTSSDTGLATDRVVIGGDIPLFDELLLSRMLKVKWYESKSMDSSKAQDDFNQMYALITSTDASSPVLRAGGFNGGLRLLNPMFNTSDTGYGNP